MVEIYENQRAPLVLSTTTTPMSLSGKWSLDHLLPTDPRAWTDSEVCDDVIPKLSMRSEWKCIRTEL